MSPYDMEAFIIVSSNYHSFVLITWDTFYNWWYFPVVGIGSDFEYEVAGLPVHVGLALTVEFVLHAVHHACLHLKLEVMLLINKPRK